MKLSNSNDILSELASRDLWWYCRIKAPDFYTEDCRYLQEVCEAWQEFENDDNELLVINMPPRHGKSRTAGLAVQWLLGRNNGYKVITVSYNEKLSRRFSKAARDDIMERKSDGNRIVYSDIFPETKIAFGGASVDLWRLDGSKMDNYLATAPSATVTGFGADYIIIDDVVKNAYEANNRNILEQHFEYFTDTLYSRLEGKRKLILIMTRWSTKDLAGRVMELYESQGRKYRVISKAAFDGSKMLNERVLSKEQYDLLIQTIGEDIVRANYDQEPIDIKGRLYSTFQTYQRENVPAFRRICAQCDTADKGQDFLCLIIYGETFNRNAYVLDVYYTKDGMNITEKEISRRLTETKAIYARFESNFGGEAFAKIIKIQLEKLGNYFTRIRTFTQTKNKEARILANSTNVTRHVIFPEDWKTRWPIFYRDVTEYQREGDNEHDDGPDCLSLVCEDMGSWREQ